MEPRQYFEHCPRCGMKQASIPASNLFECAHCRFRFYFNPTVAVAVFIRREDGEALFIRRARESEDHFLARQPGVALAVDRPQLD